MDAITLTIIILIVAILSNDIGIMILADLIGVGTIIYCLYKFTEN